MNNKIGEYLIITLLVLTAAYIIFLHLEIAKMKIISTSKAETKFPDLPTVKAKDGKGIYTLK